MAGDVAEQRIQDDLGLLRPGERIVDGMVMYSSMWLDDVPENVRLLEAVLVPRLRGRDCESAVAFE